MQLQPITFLRLPLVRARTGLGRESVYHRVRNGTLPPPLKIGAHASAWLEHEIEAINAARMAGKSDDEIRAIVAQLVAARRSQPTNADKIGERKARLRRPDGKFT
jgi:prophage regulatory protein